MDAETMRAMGNLLWFILGGVRMGLAWSSAGLPEAFPGARVRKDFTVILPFAPENKYPERNNVSNLAIV